MSVVTGVVLATSCVEDGSLNFRAINEWLSQRNFGPLVSVEDRFGGTKHPQLIVCGAGYNYFDGPEFADFVMGLDWSVPSQVVLTLTREDEATEVFRPDRR